jgi:hypothetical protein
MPPASPDQLFAYSDSLGIGQSFARPPRTRKLLGLRSVTRRYKRAIGLDDVTSHDTRDAQSLVRLAGHFRDSGLGAVAPFAPLTVLLTVP